MSIKSISRRDFLEWAKRGGLVLGSGMTSFADFSRAATNDDEHFFIFLELRGGIHWITATDGRDISQLPLDKPNIVRQFKIEDKSPTVEEYAAIVNKDFANRGALNGNFILLPFIGDDLNACYVKGQSTLGNDYILGFAATALKEHVDDLAVLRGVHVQGDFHGIANANGEIFGGLNSSETPHVAAVLSSLLTPKYGAKLLDNLVFENATFNLGSTQLAKSPVRLDAESLGYIVANADAASDTVAEARFAKARQLADALSRQASLGDLHREVFGHYIAAMKQAPAVRSMLLKLKNDLGAVDASLDLDLQFKTAMTMLQSGLSRVITLCLGTPNGKNQVDGFGLFDAHVGSFHIPEDDPTRANTGRHHRNVEKAMTSVAKFIKDLKKPDSFRPGKSMFDVTTVVIGTEFARPSNFLGNEAPGGEGGTAFGSGHYNFNNNYLMFGKGVRGGCWIGKNDQVRQLGYRVDMNTAATADNAKDVAMTPVELKINGTPSQNGEDSNVSYTPKDLNYNTDNRPFMAKDLVRTVMASAGFDARYAEAYSDERVKNAKIIKPMLK